MNDATNDLNAELELLRSCNEAGREELERLGAEVTRLRTLLAERDHTIEKLMEKTAQDLEGVSSIGVVTPAAGMAAEPVRQLQDTGSAGLPVPRNKPLTVQVELTAADLHRERSVPPLPGMMLGTPVWIDDGNLPSFANSGVGFRCRKCNVRIRRARHLDPRLLCAECLSDERARA